MKTITFQCSIQVDAPELIRGRKNTQRYIKETIELINLELQRTAMDVSPQIVEEKSYPFIIEAQEEQEY